MARLLTAPSHERLNVDEDLHLSGKYLGVNCTICFVKAVWTENTEGLRNTGARRLSGQEVLRAGRAVRAEKPRLSSLDPSSREQKL